MMGTTKRIDEPSKAYSSNKSSENKLGEPVLPTPAAPDDTIRTIPAYQPQPRAFTYFMRLPAELRAFVWEFALVPPGPRIHFLEPCPKPNHGERDVWWDRDRKRWCDGHASGIRRQRGERLHWEVAKATDDPVLRWSGRELLAVCVEARNIFLKLKHKTTSQRSNQEQRRQTISDVMRTTDIMCIRAEVAFYQPDGGSKVLDRERPWHDELRPFCRRHEQPSPRRLVLEIPCFASRELNQFRPHGFPSFVPYWLFLYREKQEFMNFGNLKVVYILDHHVKPRAHYDHPGDMPPGMYTEAFEGHYGSKFVAIDLDDKRALQHWYIPWHWGQLLLPPRGSKFLSPFRRWMTNLKLLACVKEGFRTQRLEDGRPESRFVFSSHRSSPNTYSTDPNMVWTPTNYAHVRRN